MKFPMKKPSNKTGYYAKKYRAAKAAWSPSVDFSSKTKSTKNTFMPSQCLE
jgi:hypothetical protein